MAVVVARIRRRRASSAVGAFPRSRSASTDDGSPCGSPSCNSQSPGSQTDTHGVRKKSSSRRRPSDSAAGLASPDRFRTASSPAPYASRAFPDSPARTPPPPSPLSADEGTDLYRKSSARPFLGKTVVQPPPPPPPPADPIPLDEAPPPTRPGKYVPPHLRAGATRKPALPPPPEDDFEETGEAHEVFFPAATDEEAAWHPSGAARFRSGSVCERGQRRYNEDACVERPEVSPGAGKG